MAVTVADLRTVFNDADIVTNWNDGGVNAVDFAEAANSISKAFNIATGQLYATETGIDLSDTLIYVWSSNTATQLGWATGAHSLFLGDGVDRIAFHQEGNDRLVFKHSDNQVQFSQFVLDGSVIVNKPTSEYTVVAGSLAGLITDLNAVTEIGAHYITQSKALAGGFNCFCDIIRYGNDGIRISGGTTSDRGTFLEIVTEDRAKTDAKAHGIIRELTSGVYGSQGPLNFGLETAGDSWFQDAGVTLVFEDRDIGDDKYYLKVVGNIDVDEETHFILDTCSIGTAGPLYLFDASSGGIDELSITNSVISGAGRGVLLGTDSTDATTHTFTGNTITGCGMFEPGSVPVRNCVITSSIADSTAEEAAVLWGPDGDIENSTISDSYYGMLHEDNDTVTYINITFSGNIYDIIFLGTGTLTVTVVGGTVPTYYAPNGGTVSLPSSVTLTMTVKDINGDPINLAFAYIDDNDESPYIMNKQTNASGIASEPWTGGAVSDSLWRVRKYGYKHYAQTIDIAGDDISIPVTLIADPQQT